MPEHPIIQVDLDFGAGLLVLLCVGLVTFAGCALVLTIACTYGWRF